MTGIMKCTPIIMCPTCGRRMKENNGISFVPGIIYIHFKCGGCGETLTHRTGTLHRICKVKNCGKNKYPEKEKRKANVTNP